jgi:4-hydroxybenzoate polyprenyltransferase
LDWSDVARWPVEASRLLLVGLFSIGFCLFLIWQPYHDATRTFFERLKDVDRFLRLHYFGFTWMLVLLGASTVSRNPDAWLIIGLLAVGVCVHVHGYVLNDVIDLDLDRTQNRRSKDPLVRGVIPKKAALAFALLQIPLAVLVGFYMQVGVWAWCALGACFALSFVYDKWGKRCAFPPLTDLIQGLACGSLVFFGLFAANPEASYAEVRERALPVLVYGVGFIFLINGIHGGLRDLWTDLTQQRRTTAIFLGGRPSWKPPGAAESSWRIVAFAFAAHTAMFLPSFEFLWHNVGQNDPGWHGAAWAGVGGLFALSNYVLWRVVKPVEPLRGWWISTHIFLLLLPPIVLYVTSNVTSEVFKVAVIACFFLPLALQESALDLIMSLIERGRAATRAAYNASRYGGVAGTRRAANSQPEQGAQPQGQQCDDQFAGRHCQIHPTQRMDRCLTRTIDLGDTFGREGPL